ncbi:hypothetical protein [Mucilaginibacter sp. SJ]|uniref:hypothetical protein n=1 Tax=Mucilaginibacter sp. SJ TaxID=3029053 RepID=UPI0023AA07C4|nr:hypothetical protein [Mucilaginibacter sp. SJ]WEA00975.1 hypothetical protein MusilaSJ_26315 [Mucilaginibacter sp. SJ]
MKKLILGMLAGCFFLAASVTRTNAQVSVNLNVGLWNPPAEYAGINYYYLPDVESYYYVPTHQYVYLDGGNWVWRRSLPPRYASYSIATGYKVAVNRPRAYTYFTHDRDTYARYRGTKNVIVRDNYRTRVVNRTHVVNRTKVVNHNSRPKTKVVKRSHGADHRVHKNGHHH